MAQRLRDLVLSLRWSRFNSILVWWVKDPVLPQLRLGFNPWPENFQTEKNIHFILCPRKISVVF